MAKIDAWFKFYVADFAADTMDLSPEEVGAYLRMLIHYWRMHELPDDDRKLRHITQVKGRNAHRTLSNIKQKFVAENGLLINKRMEAELEEAKAKYEQKCGAANKRWSQRSDAPASISHDAESPFCISEPEPEPEPSNYIYDGKLIKLVQKDFDEWESLYPNLRPLREYLDQVDAVMFAENPDNKKWYIPAMHKLFYQNKTAKQSSAPKKQQSRNVILLEALKNA
tara:strand:- start:103 stop:777 length:675 start_codon:yes stop_codon:yes gene_type:complete